MKHYYTNNEDLKSEPNQFTFEYRNNKIKFTSDNGVFSKTMIDYGSRVLLDAIELDETSKTLLDVGCGYGTFGICLKKVYPHLDVTMVDVNDRAINLTNTNLKDNNLEANVFISSVYDNVTDKYDVIVTNPPIRAGRDIVNSIIDQAINHLNTNGSLWVVIQKKQGAPSLKKRMEEVFGNVEVVKRDKGYYILKSINQ